jgi:hypothetical protein
MKKTLILAAALLSFGVGSAFAGDGDPHAQPAQIPATSAYQASAQAHRLFPATSRSQVNVYSSFGDAGGVQGNG